MATADEDQQCAREGAAAQSIDRSDQRRKNGIPGVLTVMRQIQARYQQRQALIDAAGSG